MHMTELLATLQDALVDWLVHGLSSFSGWQIVAYTLVTTHITIAAVTIFLHRSQAHRSVVLHALPSHFFRCWLWLGTGIVTREWVAVHRKHHAACETPGDPHSPQARGIAAALLRGSELYADATKDRPMLDQYGAGTPGTPHAARRSGRFPALEILSRRSEPSVVRKVLIRSPQHHHQRDSRCLSSKACAPRSSTAA